MKLLAFLMIILFPVAALAAKQDTKVLVLTKKNTITFRGVVTSESVLKAQTQLLKMSQTLDKNDIIYLVMDTPGGDIEAGNDLIQTIHSLPQEVKTVSVFAASMGFHIVQNLGERIVLPNSTLMSHRAMLSGASGQLPGELLVQINFIMRTLIHMDSIAAKRMNLSLKAYQYLIRDEYWVKGFESIKTKTADKVTYVKCDETFKGRTKVVVGNFFGIPVTGEMSNCPLFSGIINLKLEKPSENEQVNKSAMEAANLYKSDKKSFVKSYISSGKLLFATENQVIPK